MSVAVPKPVPNNENLVPNPHEPSVVYNNYGEVMEPWKPVAMYNNYGEPVYMTQSFSHMINRCWRQSLYHRQQRKVAPYYFWMAKIMAHSDKRSSWLVSVKATLVQCCWMLADSFILIMLEYFCFVNFHMSNLAFMLKCVCITPVFTLQLLVAFPMMPVLLYWQCTYKWVIIRLFV